MIHKFHRRRILICFLVVLAGYAALVLRLYQIQVLQNTDWRLRIGAANRRTLPIPSARGKIIASNGTVLASSIPVYSLYCDPGKIAEEKDKVDPKALARDLAPLLEMDAASVLKKLTPRPAPAASPEAAPSSAELPEGSPEAAPAPGSPAPATPATTQPESLWDRFFPKVMNAPPPMQRAPRGKSRFVWVKRKLDDPMQKAVKQYLDLKQVKGLGFRKEFKRFYPNNQLAAQVLGFVGMDEEGLEGIEHKYNQVLGGKPGSREVVVAPNGMVITDRKRHV